MISVRVFRESTGKPVKSARVSVSIDGFLGGGGVTPRKSTDAHGEVHFSNVNPCNGKIFVDGKEKHRGKIQGMHTFYI